MGSEAPEASVVETKVDMELRFARWFLTEGERLASPHVSVHWLMKIAFAAGLKSGLEIALADYREKTRA